MNRTMTKLALTALLTVGAVHCSSPANNEKVAADGEEKTAKTSQAVVLPSNNVLIASDSGAFPDFAGPTQTLSSFNWSGRWLIEGSFKDPATNDDVVVDVVLFKRPTQPGARTLVRNLPANDTEAQAYVYVPSPPSTGSNWFSYNGSINLVTDPNDGKLHVVVDGRTLYNGTSTITASANLTIPGTDANRLSIISSPPGQFAYERNADDVASGPWDTGWLVEGYYWDESAGDYVLIDIVFSERPTQPGTKTLQRFTPTLPTQAQAYAYIPANGGSNWFSYTGTLNVVLDPGDGRLHVRMVNQTLRNGTTVITGSADFLIPLADTGF